MNVARNYELSILIIDDNEIKQSKVKSFIEAVACCCAIEIADDQISAQKALESKHFDLVLLDMCLPLRKNETEPDNLGGEKLLDELDIEETYIQPTKIIALTEFESLRSSVRDRFPELGALKYSAGDDSWKRGLERTINSLLKSEKAQVKIVYCEHKNDKLYNSINLKNLEFRGLTGGSRKVYEAAKFEPEKFAIRDKDFLTKNEVKWLTKTSLPNYFILDYYCFENYLYHPENIADYCRINVIEYDVDSYRDEIIKQKEEKFLKIVQEYKISRNSYFDFTDNDKKNMDKNPEDDIVKSLESKDFETFYPYFDMKGTDKSKGFDKAILDKLNFDQRDLVKTNWFKNRMENIFNDIL